ncbi:hypothetical protein KSP40_PGU007793 [Platanthera guangdongensis]|uniref:RING-type domain-containing protein n=1 Tax=Platanthera guangdongensis TaxID=2320717 RepID=A0ABR2LKT1_9ASPA
MVREETWDFVIKGGFNDAGVGRWLRRLSEQKSHLETRDRSDHEPPQSYDNSLGELGATSSINNGSISGDRINRLFSTGNGQLPATVLEARARFLERIRGISVSQNRQEEIASGLTSTEEAVRNSLDSGRVRGISVTRTRRESGSSSEDLLYDLAAVDGFVFQIRSELASSRTLIRRTRGLGPEAIDNLLHEVFSEAEHGGDIRRQCDCSVCLESFNEGDGLLRLHCGHRFHCACLEPWLRTCGDCPYCRATI